jgi:hypothetical protein
MIMTVQPSSKNIQSVLESQTTANWQDFIVEELSDEAQAAVSGGGKKSKTTTSTVGYVNVSDQSPEEQAEYYYTTNWTAGLGG